MKTCRKPMIPMSLRDFNHKPGTVIPSFLRGPREKVMVRRMNALRAFPLFNIKNGRSFQDTGPAI
jgi:hypothetical protein